MRALTWVAVGLAVVVVAGCAEKREEELPQIDPADIQVENTAPVTPTVQVETPVPAAPSVPVAPPEPAAPAPTPAASQTYTVQKGDTLYSLARRFYGDGKLWTRIAEANRDKISDVTKVPVGAVLTIPPR